MMMNFLRRTVVTYRLLPFAIILSFTQSLIGWSQDIASHPHLTPAQSLLHRKLLVKTGALPPGEITKGIRLISTVHDIPIWLDRDVPKDCWVTDPRRLDSSTNVSESSVPELTLAEIIRAWASQADAVVVLTDGVVSIVPTRKFELIELSVWSYKLDAGFGEWNRIERSYGWDSGATMRSVAAAWSEIAGLDSLWLSELPHDLWEGYQFANSNRRAISCCLLTSMDRIAIRSSGGIGVEAWKGANAGPQVDWTYSEKDIRRLGNEHNRAWKMRNPDVVIRRANDGAWAISAKPHQHRELVQPLLSSTPLLNAQRSSAKTSTTKGGQASGRKENRYSGEMRGTLRIALISLSQSLQLDFDLPNLPKELGNRQISIEYLDVSLSELLDKIAEDAEVEINAFEDGRYEVRDLD